MPKDEHETADQNFPGWRPARAHACLARRWRDQLMLAVAQSRRRRSPAGTPRSAAASVTLHPVRASASITAPRSRLETVAGTPLTCPGPSQAAPAPQHARRRRLASDDETPPNRRLKTGPPVEPAQAADEAGPARRKSAAQSAWALREPLAAASQSTEPAAANPAPPNTSDTPTRPRIGARSGTGARKDIGRRPAAAVGKLPMADGDVES